MEANDLLSIYGINELFYYFFSQTSVACGLIDNQKIYVIENLQVFFLLPKIFWTLHGQSFMIIKMLLIHDYWLPIMTQHNIFVCKPFFIIINKFLY